MLEKTVTFDRGTDADLNLLVSPQRRSLKGILLLFIVPYTAGARDTKNYFNPDITNVEVTINGIPNRAYNNGIKGHDMWREASRLFSTKSKKQGAGIYSPNMTLAKYLTGNKCGFFLDLRSMAGSNMHGSGQRLVNSENGMQIALTRTTSGSGNVRCHIFSISATHNLTSWKGSCSISSTKHVSIVIDKPKKAALQCPHRGANEFREDAISSVSVTWPLQGEV